MFEHSNMMLTNNLLERALDMESLRKKVISNNIANVDVPHFKRSEVNFESELKRAVMEKELKEKDETPALLSETRHIPFSVPRDIRGVRPRINLDYTTTYRNDGNNVDIEKEIVDASKNLMRYNAFVSGMNHNFKILKLVMRTA